ncbi:uncharacterized transmembrane protein DDB_G0289901-like [Papaver somniferum]|uniref:uncharacterized transmembrane protein DDB_G0289901-like n=1 Tax=Papaver somniferum TaxID=3469 RepID=UPI000E6FBA54|nr:uncharacterized transmembrane protein DDB_G0289901-like [Papaver somniferum]
MKEKEKLGQSSSNEPPIKAEKPTSANEVVSEDEEELNEGDAPASQTPEMTVIRKEEKRKRISVEVTPSSEPPPQPRHVKPLGANAKNTSKLGVGGVSEGVLAISGGNKGGVSGGNHGVAVNGGNEGGGVTDGNEGEVVVGNEAGRNEGGGNQGVAVTGGNEAGGNQGVGVTGGNEAGGNQGVVFTEVGTSSDASLDKSKAVVEEDKKGVKKKYPPKDNTREIIDSMEFLPKKKE